MCLFSDYITLCIHNIDSATEINRSMDKVLSIVVPTYNMEKYLDRCLSSLLVDDDKLSLFEVLVIIDGATDRSAEIALSYQSKYPDVFRVIEKENGNYGSCINRGLAEATGKYIKILDADDSYDQIAFAGFLSLLKSTDADCVISDMTMVKETGECVKLFTFNLPADGSTFPLSELAGDASSVWMHCVCYRTDNLRRIGYHQSEGISYTDQEWICIPMSTVETLTYYPHSVYNYLVGRDGQTVAPSVWLRKFTEEITGVEVMMRERSKLYMTFSKDALKYVDGRISHRIKTIYYAYFFLFDNMIHEDKMADLDVSLQDYDKLLYDDLGSSIVMFKFFHYLNLWRKHGRRHTPIMLAVRKMFRIKNSNVECFFIR